MLWGGPSWKKITKLNHGGVKLIDFSPCERFLVTWAPEADQANALIVWNLQTGEKARAFQGAKGDEQMEWPAFQWSHDDEYFARLGARHPFSVARPPMSPLHLAAHAHTPAPALPIHAVPEV